MSSALPSVSFFYWEPVGKDAKQMRRRWFGQQETRTETLFEWRPYKSLGLEGGVIYGRFSPDYRYYYESFELYGYGDAYLWAAGAGSRQRLLRRRPMDGVFSPNSRWWAGCFTDHGDKMMFYQLPRLREIVAPVLNHTRAYACGWYPDSRQVWYGSHKGWYRVRTDNLRGRPERLSKQEYEQLFRDWDLLNARFRTDLPTLEERKMWYEYSLRGNARARVSPKVSYSAPAIESYDYSYARWQPQTLEVQTRTGQRYAALRNTDERAWLDVSAVSDDGQWALVSWHRWNEQTQRDEPEWRLYEASTGRLARRFTAQDAPPYVEGVELGLPAPTQNAIPTPVGIIPPSMQEERRLE